ncbi:Bicyclogermacrene synthase [Bienertia sinuspersici]
MTKVRKSYAVDHLKEHLQILIKNYFVEAKWREIRYHPTFEEYMVNRRGTINIRACVAGALMGMEEVREVQAFEQLMKANYKALIACENINGLLDDIVSGEVSLN